MAKHIQNIFFWYCTRDCWR